MSYNGLRGALTVMMLAIACGGNTVSEPKPVPSPSPTVEPGPSPTPQATPATCPPLQEWGVKRFITMDAAFQVTEDLVAGGHVICDSTPRFQVGGPNGQPCNAEHPLNCGGRLCEDPRGPVWKAIESPSDWEIQENPFQIHVGKGGGMKSGKHIFQTCPRGDLVDSEGFPVEALAGACDIVQWIVP